jgi:hypothetical protein
MFPGRIAQSHPAGPMLQKWGTSGVEVDIEAPWTIEQIDEAVRYGAHPSARSPVAAKALRKETMEKVNRGFAAICPWSELRQRIIDEELDHAKVSPCAAIPHKSRLFRLLLDLSDKGQNRRGITTKPSVNELTVEDLRLDIPCPSLAPRSRVLSTTWQPGPRVMDLS